MNKWIVSLVLLALIGLAIIQFNFVRIGFQLEQRQFSQSMSRTSLDFGSKINGSSELSRKMRALFDVPEKYFLLKRDSALEQTQNDVRTYLEDQLLKNGIDVEVQFAITGEKHAPIYMVSENFELAQFQFDQYSISLGSQLEESCDCKLFLHLHSNEFNTFVLKRLGYLIWPSVLCILAILICLALLIYTLNKQRKLNEIKNDFINNLTHELKTPVFSISLATKLLLDKLATNDNKDPEIKKLVQVVDKENERLKVHIDRVLELASLESEQQNLHKKPTNVNTLLEEVIEINRLKIEQLNGSVTFHESEKGMMQNLDESHFKNAIQNLIENAIKYRSKKELKIQLHLETIDHKLLIRVKDNGLGIVPSEQQRIFEKFYRVSYGNIHSTKGFGLGLSYVKQIVEAHRGSITVQSKLGEGSEFIIQLLLNS